MKKRRKQPDRQERREDAPTHVLGRGKARQARVAGKTAMQHRSQSLPRRFKPLFWEDMDGRSAAVKEIKARLTRLKDETNADSLAKELICQRATFLALILETMERAATEGGEIDLGRYTQASNGLIGLLKSLGLEKKVKKVANLKAYVRNAG